MPEKGDKMPPSMLICLCMVLLWPLPLIFWPQKLIISSLSSAAP